MGNRALVQKLGYRTNQNAQESELNLVQRTGHPIKKYKYAKALRTTKIEMCNVLHSQIIQMLVYGYPYSDVKDFFAQEVASGFVDEITKDVDYRLDYYPLLKKKDIDGIIALDKEVVRKGKITKMVKHLLNLKSATYRV